MRSVGMFIKFEFILIELDQDKRRDVVANRNTVTKPVLRIIINKKCPDYKNLLVIIMSRREGVPMQFLKIVRYHFI